MAKTTITVWHKTNGEIVAIGRPKGRHKATPMAGANQFVLETDIEEAQMKDLHRTHIVDMNTKALVKHKSWTPRP